MTTGDSSLDPDVKVSLAVPAHGRHTSKTCCKPADALPGDDYQQPKKDERGRRIVYRCTDQTGRKRREHEYLLRTRTGTRCLWCGRRPGMEKL